MYRIGCDISLCHIWICHRGLDCVLFCIPWILLFDDGDDDGDDDDDDDGGDDGGDDDDNNNREAPEICRRKRGTKQKVINESHHYSAIGLIQDGFYPRQLTRLF